VRQLRVERRRSILIAGERGAGTSVYAVSLVHWQQPERARTRLCLLPADGDAARWVTERVAVHRDGVTIRSRLTTSTRRHRFRLYQLDGTTGQPVRDSAVVSDVSCWDGPADVEEPELSSELLDEVARAHGIVLLVGAAKPAESRRGHLSWLRRTLGEMRDALARAYVGGARTLPYDEATNTLTCPVAVCVSQIDCAPDAERRDAVAWLESLIGERASMLTSYLSRHTTFKLSSTGHTPRPTERGQFIPGVAEPRGVLAPLRWVLEQTGVKS
jgi:hypothetical protein